MSPLRTKRPSPAVVLAALALVFAMVGTAIAGPDAINRAITKSKVKSIAKKQAKKYFDQNIGGASVANATNANNANNAAALGGVAASNFALAYGEIDPAGAVKPNPPNKNIVGVTNPLTGLYCVDLSFSPAFGQGGGTGASSAGGIIVMVDIPATNCPAGTDASVYVNTHAGASVDDDFNVLFGAGGL